MEDKRKLKRRHLIYYLRVFNKKTDQLIGHLVDITTEGIMLISEEPIDTTAIFQLNMTLPANIEGNKQIAFKARSLWCKKDINPDFYNTGFQLINISVKGIQIIERLIHDFSFDR